MRLLHRHANEVADACAIACAIAYAIVYAVAATNGWSDADAIVSPDRRTLTCPVALAVRGAGSASFRPMGVDDCFPSERELLRFRKAPKSYPANDAVYKLPGLESGAIAWVVPVPSAAAAADTAYARRAVVPAALAAGGEGCAAFVMSRTLHCTIPKTNRSE